MYPSSLTPAWATIGREDRNERTNMNGDTTFVVSRNTAELFDVPPVAATRTAELADLEQVHRWESLSSDRRDAQDIVSSPALRKGVTYWVKGALHALVLRQAARSEGQVAEVLFDLRMEQYAVMAATAMSPTWE